MFPCTVGYLKRCNFVLFAVPISYGHHFDDREPKNVTEDRFKKTDLYVGVL